MINTIGATQFLRLVLCVSVFHVTAVHGKSVASQFVGTWMGAFIGGEFSGKRMEVSFWLTNPDELAGVIIYQESKCAGLITQLKSESKTTGQQSLKFSQKVLSGTGCYNIAEIAGAPPNPFLILQWLNAEKRTVSAAMLASAKPSHEMEQVAAKYRPTLPVAGLETSHPAEKAQPNDASTQAKINKVPVQARIEHALNNDVYHKAFSDYEISGAWQGEFIDGTGSYDAEIALWPAERFGTAHIAGYVRLTDQACVALMTIDDSGGMTSFNVSPYDVTEDDANCIGRIQHTKIFTGEGLMELGESKNRLAIYYPLKWNFDGTRPAKCVKEIDRMGCYAFGIFTRTKITNDMLKLIASKPYKEISLPGKKIENILRAGPIVNGTDQQNKKQIAVNQAMIIETMKAVRKNYLDRQRAEIKKNMTRPDLKEYLAQPPRTPNGPFGDSFGGQYLNAIYLGNFVEVRRLDMRYALKLKPMTDYMAKTTGAIAALFSQYSSQFDDAADIWKNYEKHASLGALVIAAYMRNYQSVSKTCLASDAVTFTVKITEDDLVGRDGFGTEVYRVRGNTYSTDYTVNKEFSDAFRAYGSRNPGSAYLSDNLFNKGGLSELISEVYGMMNQYPCDSPAIKQMEARMLELFSIISE